MLKVGLTGGIASGKSTVLKMLKKKGIECIDVDEYVRILLSKEDLLKKILKTFGPSVFKKNRIHRERLRDIIISDPVKRKKLEAIVHPEVKKMLLKALAHLEQKATETVVVEVPLLFEAGWQDLFDCVITVKAPQEAAIERLMKRHGITKDTAKKWMALQMPIEEKVRLSDFVIDNSGDINKLESQVERAIRWIHQQISTSIAEEHS